MNLRDYLDAHHISVIDFSKLVGCHNITLSAYMHKRLRISKFLAQAIERVTDGKLTAKQLIAHNVPLKNKKEKK